MPFHKKKWNVCNCRRHHRLTPERQKCPPYLLWKNPQNVLPAPKPAGGIPRLFRTAGDLLPYCPGGIGCKWYQDGLFPVSLPESSAPLHGICGLFPLLPCCCKQWQGYSLYPHRKGFLRNSPVSALPLFCNTPPPLGTYPLCRK